MIVGIVHAYYLASSRKFPDPCALELATPFNTHFAQCSAASLERAKRKPSRSIYYGTQLAANADLPLDSLILSLLKNKPIAAVELSIGAYKYRVKVNTRYNLLFKGVRQIFSPTDASGSTCILIRLIYSFSWIVNGGVPL